MENKYNTDFKSIAEKFGIFDGTGSDKVISDIERARLELKDEEFVFFCNYLLSMCHDPDVLMYLIRCTDEYRHPSSLSALTDLLLLSQYSGEEKVEIKEKFNNVRMMCAKAIGNQKNTDSVQALLYCLNDKNENYRVRLSCADALGRIGDRFAVAPLIEIVKDEDEKSVYLRETAASALGLLGDARAIDPLLGILEAKHGIMNKFSFLKERAIEALNRMGFGDNERVFNALKKSLSDESAQVRIDAIEALMNSNNPNAFDTIKKCMLEDNDDEVKKNALIALYNLSDRSVLDEVISSQNYSDSLKMEAVSILNEYESEEDNG